MSQSKRKSLLLQKGALLFEQLSVFFSKSIFFKGVFINGYAKLNSHFEGGFLKGLPGRERNRGAWQYRWRRAGMIAGERSLLLRAWRRVLDFLLATALSSYGVFMLLLGAVLLVVRMLGQEAYSISFFLLPLVLILASFPLLHEKRSLSEGLLQSRLLAPFLIAFCRIQTDRLRIGTKARERRMLTLLLPLLLGAASVYLPPVLLLGVFLMFLLLTLFAATPELLLLLLLGALPFLEYSGHPSAYLLAGACCFWLLWFYKLLRGRRTLRLELIDLEIR